MFSIMRFDEALLNGFEHIGRWTEKRIGKSCFWLARVCVLLFSISLLFYFETTREIVAGVTMHIFGLFLLGGAMLFITKTSELACIGTSLNPRRQSGLGIILRIALATSLFFIWGSELVLPTDSIGGTTLVVSFFLLSAWAYLICCTPLPPQKKREMSAKLALQKI